MISIPAPERAARLDLPEPRTVFVSLCAGLAETLAAIPLLRALQARFPAARIHALTRFSTRGLLAGEPALASVQALPEDLDTVFSHAFLVQNLWRFTRTFQVIKDLGADLALTPSFCRDLLTDSALLASGAPWRVGWAGRTDADTLAELERNDPGQPSESTQRSYFYTHLLDPEGAPASDRDRMTDFAGRLGLGAELAAAPFLPSVQDFRAADDFLAEQGLDPDRTLAVFPGSWARLLRTGRLAEQIEGGLGGRPWNILLLGTFLEGMTLAGQNFPGPRRWVHAFGKVDWSTTAAVLKRLPMALGYDGEWVHLACAVERPHVLLAGGGSFGRQFPYSPWTTVACHPLECYSCDWHCRYAHLYCLDEIRPDVVGAAMNLALQGTSGQPRVVFPAEVGAPPPGAPQAAAPLETSEPSRWVSIPHP